MFKEEASTGLIVFPKFLKYSTNNNRKQPYTSTQNPKRGVCLLYIG